VTDGGCNLAVGCGSIAGLAGYEDLNDAERLAADPTFRLIGSPKIWDRGAAPTSTLHWFETELGGCRSRQADGRRLTEAVRATKRAQDTTGVREMLKMSSPRPLFGSALRVSSWWDRCDKEFIPSTVQQM